NTSYDQLGNLILQYQRDNCGGEQPSAGCFSREILGCWGEPNIIKLFSFIGIEPGDDPIGTLLNNLQTQGGFSNQEIDFMLESNTLFALLSCIFPDTSDDLSADEMRNMLLEYQAQNCQGNNANAGNARVSVDTGLLATADMVKVAGSRGISMSVSDSRADIESSISTSPQGAVLTKSEVQVLSKDSITNILVAENITHTASENKTQLINKLFKLK
ncbi:MAG: hypothetical protein KAQ62_06105, partial [Cyclobacteriaceae bacterium]|nr:hypothetical protein [Cyclobacteriaceae bacterium]